jgi:Rod binding domain-containing protein
MTGLERIGGLPPGISEAGADRRRDTPDQVRNAATQFESLLIAQMLRQVRESGSGGWMGDGEDQTSSHMMGLAEEQLAQLLAAQGGLGLANLTAGQIARQSAKPTESPRNPAAVR